MMRSYTEAFFSGLSAIPNSLKIFILFCIRKLGTLTYIHVNGAHHNSENCQFEIVGAGFIPAWQGRLLDFYEIIDLTHTMSRAGQVHRPFSGLFRIHRADERDLTLEGFD